MSINDYYTNKIINNLKYIMYKCEIKIHGNYIPLPHYIFSSLKLSYLLLQLTKLYLILFIIYKTLKFVRYISRYNIKSSTFSN